MTTLGAYACRNVAKAAVHRCRVVVFTLAPSCAGHASVSFIGARPNQLSATNATIEAGHSGNYPDLTVRQKMCRFVGRHEYEHEYKQHIERFWAPRGQVQSQVVWIGEPLSSRSLRFRSFRVALSRWHGSKQLLLVTHHETLPQPSRAQSLILPPFIKDTLRCYCLRTLPSYILRYYPALQLCPNTSSSTLAVAIKPKASL